MHQRALYESQTPPACGRSSQSTRRRSASLTAAARLQMVGDNALERAPLRGQLPPAYGQPCSTSCSSALSMTTITDLQAVNQPTTATRLQATSPQAKPA